MNMTMNLKAAAQLSVSALILSTLILPMQGEEVVPVPSFKPAVIGGVEAPKPPLKPEEGITSLSTGSLMQVQDFISTLFTASKPKMLSSQYPNGYAPMSAQQSALYAQIFDAQRDGRWDKADQLIQKIQDQRLLGHVQAQRYMHPAYETSFSEAKSWLAKYNDYPQAGSIYKLANARRGLSSKGSITKPEISPRVAQIHEPLIAHPKIYVAGQGQDYQTKKSIRNFKRQVAKLLNRGSVTNALVQFEADQRRALMDDVEVDQMQADIASAYMYFKDLEAASALAAESAERSGDVVPKAAWVAGLSFWQLNEYAKAAGYFSQVADSEYASGWQRAAGAYWAARSYDALNNPSAYQTAMEKAASHSRTFYGLLARTALGKRDTDFNWSAPQYTSSDEELLLSQEAGKRVYDLVAAGQYDIAESELLRLDYKAYPELRNAALGYATRYGLPGIALRLGNIVKDQKGRYFDSAAYPLVAWQPEDGYRLDPALVHAVMRQESRFDLNAKSYSGALGLMQVMPRTALYIAEKNGYGAGLTDAQMRMPERNIRIGQDYIEYLLKTRSVGGDVISMLVAYNAGPGNLAKWKRRVNTDDALLFIEMMPVQETRNYVEHVLSNYWIYRMRAGQEVPTMNALLSGKAPKYAQKTIETNHYALASSH